MAVASLILTYKLDWEQIRTLEQKPFVEASIELGLPPGSQTLLVERRERQESGELATCSLHGSMSFQSHKLNLQNLNAIGQSVLQNFSLLPYLLNRTNQPF